MSSWRQHGPRAAIWFILFVALPTYVAVSPVWISKFGVLLSVLLAAFLWLVFVAKFEVRPWLKQQQPIRKVDVLKMLGRFTLVVAISLAILPFMIPVELQFFLPLFRPEMMLMMSLGYLVVSVLPQRFLMSPFFDTAFRPLFPQGYLYHLFNGVSFGLFHIAFGHWFPVVASMLVGFFLSCSTNRNFWLGTFEHYLYGMWAFSCGLGIYFYDHTRIEMLRQMVINGQF